MKYLLEKKILVVQIKSESGLNIKQKSSLIGLGLRGVGSRSELICTDSALGMIRKVQNLLQISEI